MAVAPDKTSRLVWTNRGTTDVNGNYSGDILSIWSLNAAGQATAQGPSYGRYPGWSVNYVQVAKDNTTRMLWTNEGTYSNNDGTGTYSGDQVSLWAFNAAGTETAQGPTYGRYVGWQGNEYFIAPDNTVRLLWRNMGTTDVNGNYSGDKVSVWSLNTAGAATAQGPTYGPNPGWHAQYAYPVTSTNTALIWEHDAPGTTTSGYSGDQDEFTLWSLGTNDATTSMGPIYGPY